MTSEILTELRALSVKMDAIQSEVSQLNKLFADHLLTCQGHEPLRNDTQHENRCRGEHSAHLGISVRNSIEHEALMLNDDNEAPGKQTTGSSKVTGRDEEETVYGQNCNAAEKDTRSSSIASKKNYVHERTTQYTHRNVKECRAECLRKAVQQNIVLLVDNLPYSENDILDMMIENECLTETECSDIRNTGSRKDCVRNLVRIIKGRTYKVIKTFVDCVKTLHPEVTASIWQAYEKLTKDKTNYSTLCSFCVLKRSVDIKFLADHTWSVGAISDELYDEIVSGRTARETLWAKLADECNIASSIVRQNALRKFRECLMKMGQYRELVLKLSKLSFLKCACIKIDLDLVRFSLLDDSQVPKIIVTDGDENTSASPVSTPTSSRSFADVTEIISDEDDFPFTEHENYFLSPSTPENEIVNLRLRQCAVDDELRTSRSNSVGKRVNFRSLDKRRASMST